MSDPRVIRKRTGNFLEDFRPGQVFRHKGGKTVTEGLFTTFTEFAMTTNPLAKNARYARAYGYQGLVCPPGLVMLVAFSQTVEDVSENARTNLEYIDMRFGAPVYVGDTLEAETRVLGVRASKSKPNLGIVHVQSTARKNVGAADEAVVCTWQRKVQVFKLDAGAELHVGEVEPEDVSCELWLPDYDAGRDYKALAHLSSPDSYYEDFEPGSRIEHSRGRVVTDEHIHLTAVLDNTSQVHCNQFMIDRDPERYAGGKLIIFGGIPFTLCLGLSCPDVGDNALGDLIYTTGRHTAPLFAGDTVFAATDILGRRDHPERPDLGVVETRLLGHKFQRAEGAETEDAPAGWKRVQIFELDRQLVVKRRSHYAG
ncbi:MAG: MaoC family dehydratase N-terminal domain-containing protein [Deltaproteobacteria bacterium]|nr:MAG: MaoC family dehydratase N-terminal domain-containing protein [Deltaproteobacteria bacterium]